MHISLVYRYFIVPLKKALFPPNFVPHFTPITLYAKQVPRLTHGTIIDNPDFGRIGVHRQQESNAPFLWCKITADFKFSSGMGLGEFVGDYLHPFNSASLMIAIEWLGGT